MGSQEELNAVRTILSAIIIKPDIQAHDREANQLQESFPKSQCSFPAHNSRRGVYPGFQSVASPETPNHYLISTSILTDSDIGEQLLVVLLSCRSWLAIHGLTWLYDIAQFRAWIRSYTPTRNIIPVEPVVLRYLGVLLLQ